VADICYVVFFLSGVRSTLDCQVGKTGTIRHREESRTIPLETAQRKDGVEVFLSFFDSSYQSMFHPRSVNFSPSTQNVYFMTS